MGYLTEQRGRRPNMFVPSIGQFLNSTCIRTNQSVEDIRYCAVLTEIIRRQRRNTRTLCRSLTITNSHLSRTVFQHNPLCRAWFFEALPTCRPGVPVATEFRHLTPLQSMQDKVWVQNGKLSSCGLGWDGSLNILVICADYSVFAKLWLFPQYIDIFRLSQVQFSLGSSPLHLVVYNRFTLMYLVLITLVITI